MAAKGNAAKCVGFLGSIVASILGALAGHTALTLHSRTTFPRYVARKLGLRDEDCVGAGDTKGDSPMLHTGMFFIAVGNSSKALLDDITASSEEPGAAGVRIDDAAGDKAAWHPRLYFVASMNFADGVTEGLKAFHARKNDDDFLEAFSNSEPAYLGRRRGMFDLS